MRDPVLRYAIFPVLDTVTGCLRRFRFLSRIQWDQEALQRWRDERVRKLVSHAYSTVPFYRRIYDSANACPSDVRRFEDLTKLPIVSKNDLKRSFPHETVSSAISRLRMRHSYTSGTGQMFDFYDDTGARGYVVASRLLFESWMGLRVGDRTARLTNWPPSLRTILIGEIRISASRLEDDIPAAVRIISSVKPTSIIGDGSILSSFANGILRAGVDGRMRLRGIATSAEVLLPYHRNLIGRAFDCPVFDRYGLAEVAGYVAQECNEHQGLHVNEALVVAEVVKDGEPCGPRETGRLILTNLHNFAMPSIRYDTGDLATVGDECSCSRVFPVLGRIEGRSPHWVVTQSLPISWTSFIVALQSVNFTSIEKFQFVQTEVGRLTLLVTPKSALTAGQVEQLTKRLNSVRPRVKVDVQTVDSIETTASGKHVLFKALNVGGIS